jgi:hypothetical protein
VALSLRSSSGVISFDTEKIVVSSSCGDASGCACGEAAGCVCSGSTGMYQGEVVGGRFLAANGFWQLSVRLWMTDGLECYVIIQDTQRASLASFERVVLNVSADSARLAASSGGAVSLRVMAVRPVTDLESKGVRAVLHWGATPSDLDFHVYRGTSCLTCAGDGRAQVCTNQRFTTQASKGFRVCRSTSMTPLHTGPRR